VRPLAEIAITAVLDSHPADQAGGAQNGGPRQGIGSASMSDVTRIPVTGAHPYEVLVGHDLFDRVPPLLPGAGQIALLHAAPLAGLVERVIEPLERAGMAVLPIEVPDAEAGKSVSVAAACWDRLGRANFTRTDAVIGLGGGAVTDVAGFVAASWLRGVRWVPVATSLLGMVDAAVGGKTGINTGAGKNLVGAFHPPAGVICDLNVLATLPRVDLVAGLAEVVKCGFIADPEILDLTEADPRLDLPTTTRQLVERAVAVKARVVGEDLKESGRREILNYGHTLGHAIEKVEGYEWRHGHAISIGLVYAAALAHTAGRLDAETTGRHRRVLELVGLPVTYPGGAWSDLLAAMRVDKKSRGARLRFVVLDALAKPSILDGPSDELLAEVYREVSS
jgi:3-dehydroquinate synthase